MAEISSLEVLIQANADQFRKELADVNSKLGVMGKNASNGTNALTSMFSKLGRVIGTAAIGVAITKLIKSTTQLAMTAIESENLVGVVFGKSTEDIVAWSEQLSKALGLNEYTLRKNAGIFYNIANSLGVGSDNALKLSKGLVSLSGDMASFYNLSDEEAMTKLRAGITGETEPLKQLGIVVDDTTIKETAYRLGIAETGRELSNEQKVLARYMTIMEQTKTAQGDLARTIDSPANQLRILKSRVEQIGTALGAIFIPVLNAVLPYIQAFVTLIGEAIGSVTSLLGIAGIKAKGIDTLNSGIKGTGDSADSSASKVDKLKKSLLGLAAFDEMNVLKKPETGKSSGVGPSTGYKLPEYNMGLDDIKAKATGIAETLKNLFTNVWNGLLVVLQPAIDLWNVWVKPSFDGLVAKVKELWDTIMKSPIGEILKTIGQILGVVIVGAIGFVINIFTELITLIQKGVEIFVKQFNWVVDGIANIILWFRSLGDNVKKIWENIKSSISNVVTNIVNSVRDKIAGMKLGFQTFFGNIVNAIKAPINAIIDKINEFLKKLRSWRIPVIAPNGINIPDIKHLASGGIIESPTMALIGEAGREAVMPLENNTQWINELADKINGNNGGNKQPITIYLGGEKIYEKVIDYVADKQMRTGINILGI